MKRSDPENDPPDDAGDADAADDDGGDSLDCWRSPFQVFDTGILLVPRRRRRRRLSPDSERADHPSWTAGTASWVP